MSDFNPFALATTNDRDKELPAPHAWTRDLTPRNDIEENIENQVRLKLFFEVGKQVLQDHASDITAVQIVRDAQRAMWLSDQLEQLAAKVTNPVAQAGFHQMFAEMYEEYRGGSKEFRAALRQAMTEIINEPIRPDPPRIRGFWERLLGVG